MKPARNRPIDPVLALVARLCAVAGGGSSKGVREAAGAINDWAAFERALRRHRVVGLVHAATEGTDVLPGHVANMLAADAVRRTRRGVTVAAETVRLQRLLEQAGLTPVFFKGATLDGRAYGRTGVKQSKDIDFIVTEAEVLPCVAVLEANGYRLSLPRERLTPAQWRNLLRFDSQVELVRSSVKLQVEVHWALAENRRLLPAAPLIAAAGKQWVTIGAEPVRTFEPEDEFVYLCVHGARSGWSRLKWLADLHALIARAPEGEIETLYDHAIARGAESSAASALWLCHVLFALPVPNGILERIDARPGWLRFARLCLENLHEPSSPPRARRMLRTGLLLARNQKRLIGELRRWLVAPRDALDLPLPKPLHFTYPALRLPLWALRQVHRILG